MTDVGYQMTVIGKLINLMLFFPREPWRKNDETCIRTATSDGLTTVMSTVIQYEPEKF